MVQAVVVRELEVVRGGRRVLGAISLSVARGLVTGLLGPSGSGKSTLLRSIVGVQCVAYVTQAPSIYADLSVRENLRYFARIVGAPTREVEHVIARVYLEEFADQVVARLSGGQRARVSLATALLGRPELLVLDEPTVGLDPVLRRELWAMFHDLAAAGATLLVSSHVMDEADRCDELILLRDGGVLAEGTPDELRARTHANTLEDVFLRLVDTA